MKKKKNILQSYIPKENEILVLIENTEECIYKVYAVYVDFAYDRKIKIAKTLKNKMQ